MAKPLSSDPARTERMQASLDFVDKTRGTLPEVISEWDLEALNAGLRHLFADLRDASELYRQGGKGRVPDRRDGLHPAPSRAAGDPD
jgi:hypothetical protein